MWIFIIILFGLQSYTLYRIISINKIKKESEEVLEKYKGVTINSQLKTINRSKRLINILK